MVSVKSREEFCFQEIIVPKRRNWSRSFGGSDRLVARPSSLTRVKSTWERHRKEADRVNRYGVSLYRLGFLRQLVYYCRKILEEKFFETDVLGRKDEVRLCEKAKRILFQYEKTRSPKRYEER